MGRLFMLLGKSASGKDSVAKELLKLYKGRLRPVIPYTTRPIRTDEKNNVQYRFVSAEQMEEMAAAGRILERRDYDTVMGRWTYFTADDGQIDLAKHSSLMIGTIEAFCGLEKTIGRENIVPIFVTLDDGERLMRATLRERQQKMPNYAEVCRRFLADEKDYAPEVLAEKLGADVHTITNRDFGDCIRQAREILDSYLE